MQVPSTRLLPLFVAALAPLTLGAQKVRDGNVVYPTGYVIELGEPGLLPASIASAGAASEPIILNGVESPAPAPFLGGGASQRLLALASGGGGFTAAWNDSRDGNVALFVGFLDAAATWPLDGAPVHLPRSSRQVLPDLAMLGTSPHALIAGGVAWTAQEMRGNFAMLRFFEQPKDLAETSEQRASSRYLIDLPIPLGPLDGPSQVRLELGDESGLVIWAGAGKLGAVPLGRDPETGRFKGRGRLLLAEGVHPLGGLFEAALDTSGHMLMAWSEAPADGGELLLMLGASDLPSGLPAAISEHGSARPLGLEVDSSGGFWMLSTHGEDVGLEHFDEDGTPSAGRVPIIVGKNAVEHAKLTTWGLGDGPAVVLEERRDESDGRSRTGSVTLHIFAPDGTRLTPEDGFDALDAGAVDARGVQLAALGTNFLVAWTDSRYDAADVFFRRIDLTDPTRAAQRWNRDESSADQVHASLSSNGSSALVAWEDGRRGTPEVFVRSLRASEAGQLELQHEGPLATRPTGAQAFPTAAKCDDGSGLVIWKEDLGGGGWILRGQVLDTEGRPAGEARDLDPGHTTPRTFAAASLALPDRGGFLVAWVRQDGAADDGPQLLRLDHAGAPVKAPIALLARGAKETSNLDMTFGVDGNVLVVWDQRGLSRTLVGKQPVVKAARVLAGHLVTPRGTPLAGTLSFPPSPEGGDFDPSVASVLGGGYLLVWCGNEGPTRDVFARFLDARGKVEGPPLAISVRAGEQDYPAALRLPDGRLFVAWEDDISGTDHGFVREIKGIRGRAGRRAELGPRLFVDTTETLFVEDRHAPLLAPLGRGIIFVWDDLGRGKGHDVAARAWLPD